MISALSLWLPVLVSAVFVFIVSSIIHMVLSYHNNDYKGLPDEDAVMDSLREFDLEEGEYVMPFVNNPKLRETDEFKARLARGPVAFLTVIPADYQLGKKLVLWFVFSLLVGLCTAYIAGLSLEAGSHYMAVFRLTGTVAFCGYGLALIQDSIWYYRKWSTTLKSLGDAFLYALVTAGTFGWLWP